MTDIIANIFVVIIIVIFFSSFFNSYFDESKHISIRKYVMLEDNYYHSKATKTKLATIKPPPVPPAKKQAPPKPKEDNLDLKRDCNSAMKSLKVPANERKYLLTKVFNDHSPKTVQEFITLAFKR